MCHTTYTGWQKSSIAENYRYLSWKYNFSHCGWYTNITYLVGKAKIKRKILYPVSHDASVLHDFLYYIAYMMIL